MSKLFINFSNHPVSAWAERQKMLAQEYGEIKDIAFPAVPADMTEEDIECLADECTEKIRCEGGAECVLCQGESTLVYAVVKRLKRYGIKTVAACSERVSEDEVMPDGSVRKTSVFKFVQFREYSDI